MCGVDNKTYGNAWKRDAEEWTLPARRSSLATNFVPARLSLLRLVAKMEGSIRTNVRQAARVSRVTGSVLAQKKLQVALLISPPRNVLLTHAKWRAALASLERHACQTSVADAMQGSSLENSRSLSSVRFWGG